MKSTEVYALIGRVLSGEATEYDYHLLDQWLEEDEENRAIYENYRKIWHDTQVQSAYANEDKVFQKFIDKRDGIKKNRIKSYSIPGFMLWKKVGVAAAFLMVGALLYFWTTTTPVPVQPQEIAPAFIVKENPAGQKSKIVLPDGTIVWLNSESKLSYLADFNDTIRKIELEGEAYFQVVKNPKRPFVVASGKLQTTALGTAFNVKYYPNDAVTTVYLAEGAVKIVDADRPDNFVLLEPGWGVHTEIGSHKLQKFSNEGDEWTGWKDGVLYFDHASMQEVIDACKRWYNVDFSFQGSPSQNWEFSGRFRNEYLENVLKSLCYGKDITFSLQDKHVVLIFKN